MPQPLKASRVASLGLGSTGISRAVPLPPLKSFTLPTGMVMSSKVFPMDFVLASSVTGLPGAILRVRNALCGPVGNTTHLQEMLVIHCTRDLWFAHLKLNPVFFMKSHPFMALDSLSTTPPTVSEVV